MIGGLWNGLTGLTAHERAINVESNNVTNVNTIGHKADTVTFEDLMYQANGIGNGSTIQSIHKNFAQGDLRATNNDYDVAIDGKGYFIVNERGTNDRFYTRAGNFQMGSDGLLQTPDGLKVLGLVPQPAQVVSTDPTETQFTNEFNKFVASVSVNNSTVSQTINTKTTDYVKSAKDGGVSGDGFKTAGAKVADIEALLTNYREKLDLYRSTSEEPAVASTNQITTLDFNSYLGELNDSNDTISVTINNRNILQKFEGSREETLRKFADKISNEQGLKGTVDVTSGVVTIEGLVPGKEYLIVDSAVNDKAAFVTDVQNPSVGSGIGMVNSAREALKKAVELADAKLMDITSTVSLTGQEGLQVSEIQLKLANLNLSENTFGQISFEDDLIYLKDNDNKFVVGKLQTAFFTNDPGLDPQGNNLYKKTDLSGEAKYAGELNTISSRTLELSNASTGDTLTSLLVYQKAFEANSKSITTSDELLKTAINLRK